MLSEATINNYIESVPPAPNVVKACIKELGNEDLVRAADVANEDRALIYYLQNIVNKPIFGFRSEVKNARQIFGILGLARAKQLIYSYYVLLLMPKQWEVFDFDSAKFQDFQARLIHHWGKIVDSLKKEDEELIQVISIIPASLIVCEMLFRDIKETVDILRSKKNLSYENILINLTDKTLFDIAAMIAKKWDFSPKSVELLRVLGKDRECEEEKQNLLLDYMRLLLMYEMSRAVMVQSGLNDLFELDASCDLAVAEDFYKIIQSDEK